MSICIHVYTLYRDACAIPDLITDSVIITGGLIIGAKLSNNAKQAVSRYDRMGWVEDLPQLIEGRYDHGCGAYLRDDGTQVSIDSIG